MRSILFGRVKIILPITLAILGLHFILSTPKVYAMSDETVITLVNSERQKADLPPLKANSSLKWSSRFKAVDMLNKGYWSHNAPDGSQSWHFFDESGYAFSLAGENLAKDFSTPEGVVNAWMNSPAHRANILNLQFKDISVSSVDGFLDGKKTTVVVAHFGTPTEPSVSYSLLHELAYLMKTLFFFQASYSEVLWVNGLLPVRLM